MFVLGRKGDITHDCAQFEREKAADALRKGQPGLHTYSKLLKLRRARFEGLDEQEQA